jgi:protein-disulfide isomerase
MNRGSRTIAMASTRLTFCRRTRGFAAFALVFIAVTLLGCAVRAHAQFGAPPSTQVEDASVLKPPPGARIAVVEFDDLECPLCAHVNPILKAAAAQYKIPWVRHDFLIPGHPWSPKAAVDARWFDGKSKALGDEYRDEVFANQPDIYNPGVLQQFTEKFAQAHGVALPFAIDPEGKLAAAVQADTQVGIRTGVVHTPTIFVVTAGAGGTHYFEVLDADHDLYRTIDQAMAGIGK